MKELDKDQKEYVVGLLNDSKGIGEYTIVCPYLGENAPKEEIRRQTTHTIEYSTLQYDEFLKEKGLVEQFEVDKWYKYIGELTGEIQNSPIVNYQGECNGYGLAAYGNWCDTKNDDPDWTFSTPNDWIKATDKEVDEVIIKEGEKYIGKTVKCIDDGLNYIVGEFDSYTNKVGDLWFKVADELSDVNVVCLFDKNGKWAEIVEEKKEVTQEEIIKKHLEGLKESMRNEEMYENLKNLKNRTKITQQENGETIISIPEGVNFEFKTVE